ncbi:tetratricopeptide repeat protein [Paractinoplanes atraurantiacus]|uniref:Tetratricopeptide (TPR) repeat n=1 Tax=Paractinoplanes atraurantiacus TaxID=1036182 RepID=A0A285HCI5_9ACTN|nr:tetratricopeptide repeat protein [Actinoplanes atraurantiacus]SNY33459.1 Tetratricopeptide (TPR) repeat [Actinoplanes atraurantiacus]
MSSGGYEVDVTGGQGVQVGSGNTQTNIGVYAHRLPPPQSAGPGVVVHNLPRQSAVFLGRDLRVLADQLGGDDVGVVVGQAGAVHGLGGIGKSELVNHYAREYLSRYSLVWWITADNIENLNLGLAALTRRLHPVATLADAQAWALGWLQANTGWLLVLDNVEDVNDIADLLGVVGTNGQILVTTRRDLGAARWATLGLTPFRLGVLSRPASIDLLTRLTGRAEDREGADRLAEDLGDLPLALEQAAAYVSQHARMSFDDYRTLLSSQFARVASASGFGGKDDRAVSLVWTLTMSTITGKSPLAGQMMDVLAWLAPDDLPDEVLAPLADDPADIDDALALLASYSMLNQVDGMVSVHRLVQAVTRQSQEKAAEAAQLHATELLARALPNDPINNVRGWPRWSTLLPHIDALIAGLSSEHQNQLILRVGDRAATYRQLQGQTKAAIDQFELVLAHRLRIAGDEHRTTMVSRANRASAYREAGRLEEAIREFESVLAQSRRLRGQEHLDTLICRSNLASTYQAAGRLREAIPEFESALADSRRLLGEEHPDTLTLWNNLAGAYRTAGRLEEAIREFESVLTESRRLLGEEHPTTLIARINLAGTHHAAGRLEEAIRGLESVLADSRQWMGEDHPNTLSARNNLASAYQAAGRLEEAIREFESVLADRRRLLGEDHPSTLISRDNLAYAYKLAGRPES